MTTKEKVINEAIDRVEKKINEINFILNANPLIEIINIRKEAQKLLNDKKIHHLLFIAKITALSKREKEQFKLAEKGKDSIKLIDEKVKLESELYDLKNELWYIQNKK